MRTLAVFASAMLLATLSACISTTPMSKGAPPERYIDVPTPASTDFGVFNARDAKAFIPIYGEIKMIEARRAQSQLDTKLRERGFDAATELQRLLLTKLTLRDVKTRALQVDRPHKMIPPKIDLSKLPLQADAWAVLDARITGVGLDADMSGEFRPVVGVQVHLIEVVSRRVIYDNRFAYNMHLAAKTVHIPYDPRAQWESIEAIESDLPGVTDAVVGALDRIADLIAGEIGAKNVGAE